METTRIFSGGSGPEDLPAESVPVFQSSFPRGSTFLQPVCVCASKLERCASNPTQTLTVQSTSGFGQLEMSPPKRGAGKSRAEAQVHQMLFGRRSAHPRPSLRRNCPEQQHTVSKQHGTSSASISSPIKANEIIPRRHFQPREDISRPAHSAVSSLTGAGDCPRTEQGGCTP